MPSAKEGGRTRRKGRGGEDKRERTKEGAEQRQKGVTMVDIDPWGAFFEGLWEQPAEGTTAGNPSGGEPEAGKGIRPRSKGSSPADGEDTP